MGAPERVSFTANANITLSPNTTYYLQLQWDDDFAGTAEWWEADNLTPILSDYSEYSFTYGGNYDSYPGEDLGAYYITATVVPEPSTYGAMFGAALLGWSAWRRRRKMNSGEKSAGAGLRAVR